MQRNKRRITVYILTLLLFIMFAFSFKANVSATDTYVYGISSNKRKVSISVPYLYGYRYDVRLYNWKKKQIARTVCYQYANFSGVTKKNNVYYYRVRKLNSDNVYVTRWSKFKPFTTIAGNKYSYKIKSKNKRTIKVRVPKIKGVRDYLIYIGTYPTYGFKLCKVAKPGKTVVLGRYGGRKFTWGWRYYIRIFPRVKNKKADGVYGVNNFLFYKIYTYKYRYRYRYRYVYY